MSFAPTTCYKLTSCTPGDNTVLWSTDPGFSVYVGLSCALALYPGLCFTVEYISSPCTTCQPNSPGAVSSSATECTCMTPTRCYKMRDCQNPAGAFIYVSSNLNPYIGGTISCNEYPNRCFFVVAVTDNAECVANTPVPITCVAPCVCTHCYEATNCEFPGGIPWTINISTTLTLTPGSVVHFTPSQTQPGYLGNCWTIGAETIPCVGGIPITSVVVEPDCATCLSVGPPCYVLTSCDNLTILSTNSNLSIYVGTYISSPAYPGQCFYVTASADPCPAPISFPTPVPCSCPCFTLTDCNGVIAPFNTTTDLSAYVGMTIQVNEHGGCTGPCFMVTANPGPCSTPVTVTVTLGCVPCGPCPNCYTLVDCVTDLPFMTLSSPTANAVDLSTMIGQVIGKVCLDPGSTECTTGCWRIERAATCAGSQSVYVYNTFASCAECASVCYLLTNCEDLSTIHIKYTVPNATLPNPATLVGQTLGSLCFSSETGCLPGCWTVQIDTSDCPPSAEDWSTVVSYNQFVNCSDCLPVCYLLTKCATSTALPITVSNDLSLYVGQVAKICDSLGNCKCYHVEIAQSCAGSMVIDNANAGFITCEECNSCDCPTGYTKINNICQRVSSVPPTQNRTFYTAAPGSIDPLYGAMGTRFYNDIAFLPFPIQSTGTQFEDASTTPVPFIPNSTGVWGGPAGSRLNTVGIWTTVAPNPINEWIGVSHCLQLTGPKTYTIGIASDDCFRIKVDGVTVVEACVGNFSFDYWHVFEITLQAGTHVILMEGKSIGGAASLGAEIYSVISSTLQSYTTSAQVQAVTVFSTFNKRSDDSTFETGENSGYSCPKGYVYNNCNGPACSLIETFPFKPCAPTYLVTDCSGQQLPFTTNTDLSNYVGGTYKTCFSATPHSTTCFLLKDCTRLVADIITTTDVSAFLYNSISILEAPGSCFIVEPMPIGTVCSPNPVTIAKPCVCPNAQQPWPDGCYCVTVELLPTPAVSSDFQGVFQPTSYTCCEECLKVCYILTDCQNALDPVVVCNDLAAYVGKIVKITGCGDTCWQVATSPNCNGNTLFTGDITSFDTCVECLPTPPPAPVLELHPRRIKPGYFSPNCKITLEYMEKVNCTFAKQVYDHMLIARYGITVCCDHDLPVWKNRKAILDYELLIDPTMCKSTLCNCPPPCLLSTDIRLVPTCDAPVLVDALISVPCPAPEIDSTQIDFLVTPAECFCYSVSYVGPTDITVHFIDCCCKEQSIVLPGGTTPPGTTYICAATPPVTYDLPSGPCGCPIGYTYNPVSGMCESITSTPAVNASPVPIVGITTKSPYFSIWGAVLYPDITSVPHPITASATVGIPSSPPGSGFLPYFSYPELLDATLTPLTPVGGITPVSGNLTWGWDNVGAPPLSPGRLNNCGIWAGLLPNFSIEFCQNIPSTKTYILGIAADDAYKLTINGQLLVDATGGPYGFFTWALFPITLNAGVNTFKLEAVDTGVNFGLGFEIYDATFAQLSAVASPAALTPYILFTTSSLIGRNATSGPGTGYTCDPGCTLNSCGVIPMCDCVTTAPYVPCLDVVNTGDCGTAPGCNPPPPQVCQCWKIENQGLVSGTFGVNLVCPSGPFEFGQFGTIPVGAPPMYVCSVDPPDVTNLVATSQGPCGTYCGPTPPACVCYKIDAAVDCTYSYTDCNGNPVVDQPQRGSTFYICAQSMPIPNPSCLGSITISSTPFACVDGVCGPPFPCDCYKVDITVTDGAFHSFSYYDCGGNPLVQTYAVTTTVYLCGSNFNNLKDSNIVFTPLPNDCDLGECHA